MQLFTDADDASQVIQLYGCQLPSWLHDSALLPSVYRKVFDKSLSLDGSIDTAKVTDILLSSSIPKDKLRDIWEMANRRNPGLLVEHELYLVLGLVALSQVNFSIVFFHKDDTFRLRLTFIAIILLLILLYQNT